MTTIDDLFKKLSALRKEGRQEEAIALLQPPIARSELSVEDLDRAGRLLGKSSEALVAKTRVLVLGQCTTSWFVPMLTALAWGRGQRIAFHDGEYDNVLQEIMTLEGPAPDALILLPWNRRLLGDGTRSSEARVADEVAFWQQAWSAARSKGISRIIQVGYDWVEPGPLGAHLSGAGEGDVAVVRRTNEALRRAMGHGYFVDLEQISGSYGRSRFYEPRQYFWTKQPFSGDGVRMLSEHLLAGLRALTSGPKKVLVLDLDNTLWGGVVGETGPLGIAVGDSPDGEAFRSFQKFAKGLAQRGVVLAVASKNNPADAREPFEKNPDMVLRLEDIAAFEAHWEPKAKSLQRIAKQLNLGLDSFVFFDDNPAEREHIRQSLPEVEVVEVPEEPSEYVRALSANLAFETANLTKEDLERSEQYSVERKRQETQAEFGSLDEYLVSIEMEALARSIDDADMLRVVQLLGKTNQFNVTTRRHTEEDVRRLISTPGSVARTFRLKDRFGDYGLVGLVIAVPVLGQDVPTLRIDTFLMSCRVIARTMEQLMLRVVAEEAMKLGYARLLGEFISTAKNALVVELYDHLGFERVEGTEGPSVFYRLDLTMTNLPQTFVKLAG